MTGAAEQVGMNFYQPAGAAIVASDKDRDLALNLHRPNGVKANPRDDRVRPRTSVVSGSTCQAGTTLRANHTHPGDYSRHTTGDIDSNGFWPLRVGTDLCHHELAAPEVGPAGSEGRRVLAAPASRIAGGRSAEVQDVRDLRDRGPPVGATLVLALPAERQPALSTANTRRVRSSEPCAAGSCWKYWTAWGVTATIATGRRPALSTCACSGRVIDFE
jgi:hypothetical protein